MHCQGNIHRVGVCVEESGEEGFRRGRTPRRGLEWSQCHRYCGERGSGRGVVQVTQWSEVVEIEIIRGP